MRINNRMLESSVINSCTSDSDTDFLAASQGKYLNENKQGKYLSSYELIIDTVNGLDLTADGSELLPFKTITAAYNYLSDFNYNVTFRIKAGTYNEAAMIDFYKNIINFTIQSFSGTNDVIISSNSLDNRSSIFNIINSHKVSINNITFNRNGYNSNGSCIDIDSTAFDINNCSFKNGYTGIKSSSCNGQINNCSFENLNNAINANKASHILSINNSSNTVNYGVVCNGSFVINYGNELSGTTLDYITTQYGQVITGESIVAVATGIENDQVISRGGTDIE